MKKSNYKGLPDEIRKSLDKLVSGKSDEESLIAIGKFIVKTKTDLKNLTEIKMPNLKLISEAYKLVDFLKGKFPSESVSVFNDDLFDEFVISVNSPVIFFDKKEKETFFDLIKSANSIRVIAEGDVATMEISYSSVIRKPKT